VYIKTNALYDVSCEAKKKERSKKRELWFARVYVYVIKHLSQTAAEVVMPLDRNAARYVKYFLIGMDFGVHAAAID
jgi:hypothetical protein